QSSQKSQIHRRINSVVNLLNSTLSKCLLAIFTRLTHCRLTRLVDTRHINRSSVKISLAASIQCCNFSMNRTLNLRIFNMVRMISQTIDPNSNSVSTLDNDGAMLELRIS